MNNGDTPATACIVKPSDGAVQQAMGLGTFPPQPIAHTGLTKREAFAMAAMQNVILNYNPWEHGDFDSSNYEDAATQAVGLADALLKELSK